MGNAGGTILENAQPSDGPKPQTAIVLVVEDEVLIRMAMANALRRLGLVAIEASSADEAMDVIHAGLRPDAVLTDILMPGAMDGLHLAALLEWLFPGLPVFVMSAVMEREDLRLRLNFLPKPIDSSDVARTIADALSARPHQQV